MRISLDSLVPLVTIRERMGAELVEGSVVIRPDPLTWDSNRKTIQIGPGDVGRGGNNEIIVHGKYALLYIQDTGDSRVRLERYPEKSKKYHFYHCNTLEKMLRENRFERYVVTLRSDGYFTAHSREMDGRSEKVEARLAPCMHCLAMAGYQGDIFSFSLEDYLAKNEDIRAGRPMPRSHDTDHRRSNYNSSWAQVSLQVREQANWRCADCGVNLQDNRNLLHTHHVNGVKSDDTPSNLRALCILCHGEQAGHNLHIQRSDMELVRQLRMRPSQRLS